MAAIDLPSELHDHLLLARRRGTLGAAPLEEHVRHALCYVTILNHQFGAKPCRILDLGSGAGIPGLVVFAHRNDEMVLLEGSSRRAEELRKVVERLKPDGRLSVDSRRAEIAGHDVDLRQHFDAVLARGFARPAATAECAAPFLRLGGVLIVSDPPEQDPLRWPATPLKELGLVQISPPPTPFSFTVFEQRDPCPERFARRVGVPEKRPLF